MDSDVSEFLNWARRQCDAEPETAPDGACITIGWLIGMLPVFEADNEDRFREAEAARSAARSAAASDFRRGIVAAAARAARREVEDQPEPPANGGENE
jgi:hypothetical protein